MSQQKKSRWPELGIITKNEVKDKDGNVLKDDKGVALTRLSFKLSDEVYEVLRKAGLNVTKYGILQTPIEEVDGLIKAGVITEDKIEERKQTAKDAHKWLRYKVNLPPPRAQE